MREWHVAGGDGWEGVENAKGCCHGWLGGEWVNENHEVRKEESYIEIVSENSVWGVKIGERTGLEPK